MKCCYSASSFFPGIVYQLFQYFRFLLFLLNYESKTTFHFSDCCECSARAFLSTESIQQAYDDATKKVTKCWAFLKRYLNVDIWKNKGYIIWAIGVTFALFGYFIPLVHIVSIYLAKPCRCASPLNPKKLFNAVLPVYQKLLLYKY